MAIYLLNTAVLTAYGQWQFEGPLDAAACRPLLKEGFVSAVGHAGAAEFLQRLLGVEVPVQRIAIEMQPGDRAVVLRLKDRLPEGQLLSDAQMQAFPFELGLLTRLK